ILRVRIDEIRDDEFKVFAHLSNDAEWREVYDSQRSSSAARIDRFVAMGPKPDTAYVITRNGGDRRAAYEFNLRNGTLGPLLFQDPKFDVDGFQVDAYAGDAVGVSYADNLQRVVYFDPALASLIAKIRALLPGEQVNLVTWSRDRSSLIVRADGPSNRTGAYYFADTQTGQISRLGARYPSIAEGDIATVRSFTYVARDGLAILAYLTLPPRSAAKNLAMIVMPHGGPEARDTAEFDRWAQFLATRGYAVFQPQFRGSDGFGWSFRQAGRLQWGLKMQDDITDGVKALIGDGTADPARICIFGWSYGGYAALAGLAFTPELYKCGVAGAGVSDLRAVLADEKTKNGGRWDTLRYWPSVIGDPFKDVKRLEATSPARHAENIRARLLLLHAKDDTIVRISQSELMARAMEKAGKPFEIIKLEGDDHWLSHSETEIRVLRELERFLGKNLQ
ncbi:MAG: prolyl oligopeptidase family serine peptidase, partial [Micropepsaceae bacterium]